MLPTEKTVLFILFILCFVGYVSNITLGNCWVPAPSQTSSDEALGTRLIGTRLKYHNLNFCFFPNSGLSCRNNPVPDSLRLRGGEPQSDWIEDKLNKLFTDSSQSTAHKKISPDAAPAVEGLGAKCNTDLVTKGSVSSLPLLDDGLNHKTKSTRTTNVASDYAMSDVSTFGIDHSWVRKRIDSHFALLSTASKSDSNQLSSHQEGQRSRSATPDDVMDVLNNAFSTDRKPRIPFQVLNSAHHLDTAKVIRKLQATENLKSSTPENINVRELEQDEDDALLGHGSTDADCVLLPNMKIAKADPIAADRMFQTILGGRLRSAAVLTQYADFLATVRKDNESAERHYREALGMKNDYAPALCGLGVLLLESRRDLEELERLCLLAVRHAPKHPPILCLYGRWLESIMLKSEQAEDYYRKAIEESQRLYSPAFTALADLLQGRKDFSGAEAAYVEAATLSQDDPTAQFRYGHMLLYALGRVREAEMLFQRGLEIDGLHTDLLCHYGILLLDFKGDIYQVDTY